MLTTTATRSLFESRAAACWNRAAVVSRRRAQVNLTLECLSEQHAGHPRWYEDYAPAEERAKLAAGVRPGSPDKHRAEDDAKLRLAAAALARGGANGGPYLWGWKLPEVPRRRPRERTELLLLFFTRPPGARRRVHGGPPT
jgi:hypothetical protein